MFDHSDPNKLNSTTADKNSVLCDLSFHLNENTFVYICDLEHVTIFPKEAQQQNHILQIKVP